MALLEASASVGLEGERISTAGMVMRLTSNLAIEEESRTTEMALKLLSVIKRPGDIFNAPVETLRSEFLFSPFGTGNHIPAEGPYSTGQHNEVDL